MSKTVTDSDWLTQNKKKYNDKVCRRLCVYAYVCMCVLRCITEQAPSTGRKDRGNQGKLPSERSHAKTYLMPTHSKKKREHVMANNLGSDEEDPELQVYAHK